MTLPQRTAKARYKKSNGAKRLPSAVWYPFMINRFPNKLHAEAIMQIATIKNVTSGQPSAMKGKSDLTLSDRIASEKKIPMRPIKIKTTARLISKAKGLSEAQNLLIIIILQA